MHFTSKCFSTPLQERWISDLYVRVSEFTTPFTEINMLTWVTRMFKQRLVEDYLSYRLIFAYVARVTFPWKQ